VSFRIPRVRPQQAIGSRTRRQSAVTLAILLVALVALPLAARSHGAVETTPVAVGQMPSEGFALHVDAKLHFPGDPEFIAHHYCKPVRSGMIECLLFDSDAPDAHVVGIEVIVDKATYDGFDAEEQQFWHYHRAELPMVSATLPDLSEEEAAAIVESLQETYGKLYILWDPSLGNLPVGQPSITVLH
jgi:hypothetical protein